MKTVRGWLFALGVLLALRWPSGLLVRSSSESARADSLPGETPGEHNVVLFQPVLLPLGCLHSERSFMPGGVVKVKTPRDALRATYTVLKADS